MQVAIGIRRETMLVAKVRLLFFDTKRVRIAVVQSVFVDELGCDRIRLAFDVEQLHLFVSFSSSFFLLLVFKFQNEENVNETRNVIKKHMWMQTALHDWYIYKWKNDQGQKFGWQKRALIHE